MAGLDWSYRTMNELGELSNEPLFFKDNGFDFHINKDSLSVREYRFAPPATPQHLLSTSNAELYIEGAYLLVVPIRWGGIGVVVWNGHKGMAGISSYTGHEVLNADAIKCFQREVLNAYQYVYLNDSATGNPKKVRVDKYSIPECFKNFPNKQVGT